MCCCWLPAYSEPQRSNIFPCLLCLVPSISCQWCGGMQQEFSFQGSSYPTVKTWLILIGTRAALRGKFCLQLHQKGTRELGLTEQAENQDHLSETGLLAAIFFLVLMALSYCHTWNQIKCMFILLYKAISFSFYNKSGVLANPYTGYNKESSCVYNAWTSSWDPSWNVLIFFTVILSHVSVLI